MGLMTGLAIGAALGGGLLAGKKLKGKPPEQAQQANPPTADGPLTGVPPPPIVNPGADQAAAQAAGARQRKRASLGGIQMRPLPKPGGLVSKAAPKTLAGY